MPRTSYDDPVPYLPPYGRGNVRGTAVGASIWQTPGGTVSEINRINDDINLFGKEVSDFVSALPGYPGDVGPKYQSLRIWYGSIFSPWWQAWGAFYGKYGGSDSIMGSAWRANLWWNHAPEAEEFATQLVEMRAAAAKLGMAVQSPTPSKFAPSIVFDPTDNIVDKAVHGAEGALSDAKTMAKVALYGGLAVAGVVALSSVYYHLKEGSSPTTPYTNLARRYGK